MLEKDETPALPVKHLGRNTVSTLRRPCRYSRRLAAAALQQIAKVKHLGRNTVSTLRRPCRYSRRLAAAALQQIAKEIRL